MDLLSVLGQRQEQAFERPGRFLVAEVERGELSGNSYVSRAYGVRPEEHRFSLSQFLATQLIAEPLLEVCPDESEAEPQGVFDDISQDDARRVCLKEAEIDRFRLRH